MPDTKEMDPKTREEEPPAPPDDSPPNEYIDRGIEDAERYANQQGQGDEQDDESSGNHPRRARKLKRGGKGLRPGGFGGEAGGGILRALGTRVVANPYVLIAVGIVLLIIIIVMVIANAGGGGANQQQNSTQTQLKLTKSGPTEAKAGDVLRYQISVAYPDTAKDITVTDRIPIGTEFDPSNPPSARYDAATRTVTWNFREFYPLDASGNVTNVNATLTLNLKATADNSFLVNQAEGSVTPYVPPQGVNGDIGKLLPNPLPSDPEGVEDAKNTALNAINQHKAVYQAASAATGVPWQVFAGIHYREGSAAPNTSLVSGRPIGGNEPDVVAGPGCSNSAPQGVDDGIPEPFSGGCKFASMLDSGIYGGNLLKGKVGGEITSFEILVKALSRYNGGGNSNCGKGVPYNGCPRLFEGEDDPYALNFFDAKHKPMYVIYCADYTKCNPPREDGRPGTASVAKWAAQGVQ